MDISAADRHQRYSSERMAAEDEKEDEVLLADYTSTESEEDEKEELFATDPYSDSPSGSSSPRGISSRWRDININRRPILSFLDSTTSRLQDRSRGLLSRASTRNSRQLKQTLYSTIRSFLIFLIPSFVYLWRNDRPRKLHPTAYLDGLRGVAALFVVFHHYACQFVPALLEGWGTEHDNYWLLQFPIIRVTHNGTLMVEIFFVLSGFVLSVRGLKLARQGRQVEFVKSLSSSAFRRWMRLVLPVIGAMIVSLIIVRLEWWKPLPLNWLDSRRTPESYIITPPVVAPAGASLNVTVSDEHVEAVLNATSALVEMVNGTVNMTIPEFLARDMVNPLNLLRRDDLLPTQRIQWLSSPIWMAQKTDWFHQIVGFIGAVSYIVDPFNTNGVPMTGSWPAYDSGVLWTIPVEWTGSMITFIVVLGTAWVRPAPKLCMLIAFASWGYYSGQGVLTQFVSGIILAEMTIVRESWAEARQQLPTIDRRGRPDDTQSHLTQAYMILMKLLGRSRQLAETAFWSMIFLIGLFLGSFPYTKGEDSVGWSTITSVLKSKKIDINGTHLFFASSILIIMSLNHSSALQKIFTTRLAQYLGRISFSVYLLHMQVLWTVGTRVFPFTMWLVGGGEESQIRFFIGMMLAGSFMFPLQFWISDVFTRGVDEKAIQFTKYVADKLLVYDE